MDSLTVPLRFYRYFQRFVFVSCTAFMWCNVADDEDAELEDPDEMVYSNVWHIPNHLPPFPDVIEVRPF